MWVAVSDHKFEIVQITTKGQRGKVIDAIVNGPDGVEKSQEKSGGDVKCVSQKSKSLKMQLGNVEEI